jgi:rhamnulokinase
MISPVAPGTVLADLDRRFGAGPEAVVIAPATHDTASAIAAIPFQGDNEAFISSGTWSLMGFESPTPCTDALAQGFNFSNEGGVEHRYGVLKNIVGLWQVQQIAKEVGLGHAELVAAANQAPAWVSLIDPSDHRFLAPPSMSAAIQAFCRETGQPAPTHPGSLARCVFDSLALNYQSVKGEIETLRGHPLSLIRIVGGGSQNRLLNQLCADACQVPVQAGPVETSAIGNAYVQLIALGVFRSLGEARELIRRSYPVETYLPERPVPAEACRRFQSFAHTPAPGAAQ